jgi:hypothetical protein
VKRRVSWSSAKAQIGAVAPREKKKKISIQMHLEVLFPTRNLIEEVCIYYLSAKRDD